MAVDKTQPWVIVHSDAPDTERAAGIAATKKYPRVAAQVLDYLLALQRTGMVGDFDSHGAQALGLWLNSYAPARNALMRRGYVEDSGVRELNERNRPVIVWAVTPEGRTAAATGDL